MMKSKLICLMILMYLFFAGSPSKVNASPVPGKGAADQVSEPKKLENPVTVQYMKTNLRKSTPRLVLTPAIEKTVYSNSRTDPFVKSY